MAISIHIIRPFKETGKPDEGENENRNSKIEKLGEKLPDHMVVVANGDRETDNAPEVDEARYRVQSYQVLQREINTKHSSQSDRQTDTIPVAPTIIELFSHLKRKTTKITD